MKLTSTLSFGILAAVAMSAAYAVDLPKEMHGIYATQKSECAASVAEYRKDKDALPYLLITKKVVSFGHLGSCSPTKISAANGVYAIKETCSDEDGKSKLSANYALKGDVLTRTLGKNDPYPSTYVKCAEL